MRLLALLLISLLAAAAEARPGPHYRSDGYTALPPPPDRLAVEPPLFADHPEVRAAVGDLVRKRYDRARTRLLAAREQVPAALHPALAYLIARCDAGLGAHPEAEQGLAEAAAAFPELADHLLAERARLFAGAGDFRAADALVAQLGGADPRVISLNFDAARRALAERRPGDAVAAIARAAPYLFWQWDRARAERLEADARLALDGDRTAWLRRLAALWRRWPGTDAAREAEDDLLRAYADPRQPSPLEAVELVDRAAERAHKRWNDRGRGLAAALARRHNGALKGLDDLLRVESYAKSQAGRALREVDQALARDLHPAVRDLLLLRRARALRALGRIGDTLDAFERAGRDSAFAHHAANALVEGGLLARKVRRDERARALFERFLEHHGGPADGLEHRGKAIWILGWIAWLEQRLDDADRYFGMLIDEHPGDLDHSKRTYYERALYWRARLRHARGQLAEAQRLWRFVHDRFPLSYYGVLSRQWLDLSVPAPEGPDPRRFVPPRPAEVVAQAPQRAAAITLWRLGLVREAQGTLRHQFNAGALDVEGVQLLSALYREEDDAWRSHWIVKAADPLEAWPEEADGPVRARWLSAYPTPFEDVVAREAAEHEVDPHLIWAVMRQESGFRVQARSHARALGLMQVLFPTAKLVATKYLKEPAPKKDYVFTPRGNVHYGTAYLRHLLDRFDGNLALAVAGYNAGPGAPISWMKRFGHLRTDEFVEEMPYDEARGYTRKVLSSYAVYRVLYGPRNLRDPWKLPKLVDRPDRPVATYFPSDARGG